MAAVTLGVKMDEALRERVREAAQSLGRTPHWLIKQAVLQMVEAVERGQVQPGATLVEPASGEGEANDEPVAATATPAAPQPFLEFAQAVLPQSDLRAAITAAWHRPEPECLPALLRAANVADPAQRERIRERATRLVDGLRARRAAGAGGVEALVQEFSLSSQEGVALMCLAEALLRIPDNPTRDALIRDKISRGDWQAHLGHSPSLFVNAAVWGLMLTGKLTATASEKNLANALTRLIGKGGEPLIRQGVHRAMKLMGEQFVTGQTIGEALANSRAWERKGFRYSYDMLGEAAATEADAARYLAAYEQAIHAIGRASHGRGIFEGPGISVKLSALHPRYSRAQRDRVMAELLPRLTQLLLLARRYDIGLNIDAEEADRLELSLDLLEALAFDPRLKGWNGIGFVVQAYSKRCPYVIDWLVDLARRSGHRLMVRLVKGAYWDSEIKRAQLDGLDGYPVYTRKVHTDVAYLACARRLLAAPDAVYPQFATHNAQTVASLHELAGANYYAGQYEFQCLHGMGEALYEQVVAPVAEGGLARPCRIYAPVGTHETLLAYLVRRLLENGANTSFVNRIGDPAVPVAELVADPVEQALAIEHETGVAGAPHPRIPLPRQLYADAGPWSRLNSAGLNLAHEQQLASLAAALLKSTQQPQRAAATVDPRASAAPSAAAGWQPVTNPADARDLVGWVRPATAALVGEAAVRAAAALPIWQATPPAERAAALRRAADLLEQRQHGLLGLIVREAGKSLPNAVAEVREAVDFLRYDAAQVEASFDNDSHRPLGVVACISPWNFPLAIFCGQVAAALAAGNVVLAKPAEQTPLIAAQMVALLHEAGVPHDALQLLPGDGETVGAALVAQPQVAGVMFTGSTEVARLIAGALAQRLSPQGRPIPLVAETGGINAMVVDSSALAEQVVADVIASAFDSAGQRCSALRLLCLQDDGAERVLAMLKAAMQELVLGPPDHLASDVGPVIDEAARAGIERHVEAMRAAGMTVTRAARDSAGGHGHFVPPTLIELDDARRLKREVFGPVLHMVRWRRDELPSLVDAINASGYGLTFGVHSRIDETIAMLAGRIHAGNLYVNRNVIGAVVGVQPFGGMGLSGTGPKAGGPLALHRLLQPSGDAAAGRRSLAALSVPGTVGTVGTVGAAGSATAGAVDAPSLKALRTLAAALKASPPIPGLDASACTIAAAACEACAAASVLGREWTLPGPTGESNRYRLLPRGTVRGIAATPLGALVQIAAALATGNRLALQAGFDGATALRAALPADARALLVDDAGAAEGASALLFEGDGDALRALLPALAAGAGPLVRVESLSSADIAAGALYDLSALMHEQSLSTNTAAAGGNAALMTMG
ncbi:MAG: trifunctional transcriptional regulator/proline dehydrogenase/L-glutamate gamma-semialdehyde dehydrogenase [Rubrivivax sp.]|nr:trifunctional transcriptional regulator/proline dehydrogenase/L-glutamate gamma-semialdehyde dehydrogenase [Rubrivivax sp.]